MGKEKLNATILLIEGTNPSDGALAEPLRKEGLVVVTCHTARAAFKWLATHMPDLVVLDASSLRSNGVRTCRRLRKKIDSRPIIHARSTGEPLDKTAEADVYLVRPFTARKVMNRIRLLLPPNKPEGEVLRAGGLTLYPARRSVDVAGQGERRLTPKLNQLLKEFMLHPNEVLTRHHLMQTVWQTDYLGDTRTLDVHIRWVREIIEEDPARPFYLTTIRGVGYIFRTDPYEISKTK